MTWVVINPHEDFSHFAEVYIFRSRILQGRTVTIPTIWHITANPTWGDICESSKLKARSSLLPRFSEKRRLSFELSVKRDDRALSFELWNSIRKCHPKWDWLYCLQDLWVSILWSAEMSQRFSEPCRKNEGSNGRFEANLNLYQVPFDLNWRSLFVRCLLAPY